MQMLEKKKEDSQQKRTMHDVSIIIVNFNTKDLLRKCLHSILKESKGLNREIIVVDNGSTDGSSDVILKEFPDVKLIRSDVNLGFGPANNVAFKKTNSRHIVLLNSDAFLHPGALSRAILRMDADPTVGMAGGRIVSEEGQLQPSARMFPSPLNNFLHVSGLAEKYPKSKFFGRADRSWASPDETAEVDWIPGAFSIIRRSALESVGYFDERFFLYYEEVDLCNRMKDNGYTIRYWPDIVITHIGGATIQLTSAEMISKKGSQLELWRVRSCFLYYRKYWGYFGALIAYQTEKKWHQLRVIKNRAKKDQTKVQESQTVIELLDQAWKETEGGNVSPPAPW